MESPDGSAGRAAPPDSADAFQSDMPLGVRRLSEGSDEFYVPKTLCHGCQHFGRPPEVRCGYDGSEIIREVNTRYFEVSSCPKARAEIDAGPTAEH